MSAPGRPVSSGVLHRDDARRAGVPRGLRLLEPLAPLGVAVHGAAVQLFDPGGWPAAIVATALLVVVGVAGLLGWRTSAAATVRAATIVLCAYGLLAEDRPSSGFLILWFFVVVTVYPLVLPRRRSAWLAVAVPAVYLLLVPLDAADGPVPVALVRAGSLAALATFTHQAASAYRTAVGDGQDTLALLDTYIDATPVGLGFWDTDLALRRRNGPLTELLSALASGTAPGNAVGTALGIDGEPRVDGGGGPPDVVADALLRVMRTGRAVREELVEAGDRVWTAGYYPVRIGERLLGVGGVVIDITEQRQAGRALAHSAMHDALTGLPNRVLFHDRLELALVQAEREGNLVAVLFCDLDRFKVVNDSLGHAAGDDLLRGAAQRLAGAVRAGDTVARLGGDEFAVLCPRVTDVGEATGIAERIRVAVRAPMRVAGREAMSTMSVGVTVCAPGEGDVVGLLRDADVAMYRAKDAGRDAVVVFDSSLRREVAGRFELHGALRRAVEEQQITVAYQPVVMLPLAVPPDLPRDRPADPPGDSTDTRPLTAADVRVVGVEALARWDRPGHGPVPPGLFVPIAEDLGLVAALGEQVLRTACTEVRGWRERTGLPLTVSVNLSARQLASPDCADVVGEVLRDVGLPAEALQLEITESVLMTDLEHSASGMRSLRALGVRLAIDDFGTGYSSLAYLRDLPVDVLKIDRSFTGRLPDDADIFAFIVDLARAIGATTVVEGVETAEQAAAVAALDCDLAQGYLVSRPLTAWDTAVFLGLHPDGG